MTDGQRDRTFWVDALWQIAHPVLEAGSQGRLRADMPVEGHPAAREWSHLEAVGRTLCGIAPGEGAGGCTARRRSSGKKPPSWPARPSGRA